MSSDKIQQRISYLKTVKPFDVLPDNVLRHVAEIMQENYYQTETVVYKQDETQMPGVDLVVEGEYTALFFDSNHQKRLVEQYQSGSFYGGGSALLNKKVSIRTVIAQPETRILTLDKEEFKALCRGYELFFYFFSSVFGHKVLNEDYARFVKRHSTRDENFLDADKIYSRKLNEFEGQEVVTCPQDMKILDAAKLMRQKKCSCLFVQEGKEFMGFITHRSIIEFGLANDVPIDAPVKEIMGNPVIQMQGTDLVYEAILEIFRQKIDYIVVDFGGDKKMLSKHKLLSEHAQSPLIFIQTVRLARTEEELKQKWEQAPEMINQLIGRGVKSLVVNQIVTTISDTILHRIIKNTLSNTPEPPAKFAYMVLGSEGRMEQTLLTDQDNAIVYEDKANEKREEVRQYFLKFAKEVSDKLNYVGFQYCTGGYMASNPNWTHSLSHWKNNYKEWIEKSQFKTVINVTTFFDCRFIFGDKSLVDHLNTYVANELSASSSKFYFIMAKNALQYEAPLTRFNKFKTIATDNGKVLDIKKTMTPFVDMARMYSLKHGINKTNTGNRLKALYELGVFREKQYRELSQAYYYLMGLRLKTQARTIIHDNLSPTNHIVPEQLTQVEQITLREIFKVIKAFQYKIKLEFGVMD